LLAVAAVSVLQFAGDLTSWTHWEFNRPFAWARLIALTGTAVVVLFLWNALQEHKARLTVAVNDLQTVIDLVPVAIAMAEEPNCEYIRVNPTLARLMGVEPGVIASVTGPREERPRNFAFFRDGERVPGEELPVQTAAATGRPTPRGELQIVRDDGTTKVIAGEAVPLFDDDGEIRGSVGAFVDLTEIRQTESELRKANAIKDEFLGLVSHELRTPITIVCGNAEILDKRWATLDEESKRTAIHDIRVEGERLSRLVDNLLVLARFGLFQLPNEPILPLPLVKGVVDEHQRLHPERELEVHGDAPVAIGAPVAVQQVVDNLLSNAEKYSPAGAPIDVSLRETRDSVEIAVHDQGEGFVPEEFERAFEPFYRAEGANDGVPGLGIGLAVCRRLVEAQGGVIWARRPRQGGFEVAFTLPLEPEEAATAA
jgi:signal transduction histidine kinase